MSPLPIPLIFDLQAAQSTQPCGVQYLNAWCSLVERYYIKFKDLFTD